jgi:hypothetical protein
LADRSLRIHARAAVFFEEFETTAIW